MNVHQTDNFYNIFFFQKSANKRNLYFSQFLRVCNCSQCSSLSDNVKPSVVIILKKKKTIAWKRKMYASKQNIYIYIYIDGQIISTYLICWHVQWAIALCFFGNWITSLVLLANNFFFLLQTKISSVLNYVYNSPINELKKRKNIIYLCSNTMLSTNFFVSYCSILIWTWVCNFERAIFFHANQIKPMTLLKCYTNNHNNKTNSKW